MAREAQAVQSLRRAITALEDTAVCLVDVRAGTMDRCRERLEQAAAALSAVRSNGIPAEQKHAIAESTRLLKQRMETVRLLASGLERLLGMKPAAEFQSYTPDGETEAPGAPGTLLFEL